jgi:hypothetical protein
MLNEDEDAERRLQAIKEEVSKTKQEVREKNEQMRRVGEELKNQHTQTIEMEQKCRKITQALKGRGGRNPHQSMDEGEALTPEQVEDRIREIEDLEYQKKQEEKKYEKLIRQVEARILQVEHDKNIWAIKLKEKDQEFRLNELRIKELKRQVPHKALKPLPSKENSKQQKRNQKPVDPRTQMKKEVKGSPKKQKTIKESNQNLHKEKDDDNKLDEDEPRKPKNQDIKIEKNVSLGIGGKPKKQSQSDEDNNDREDDSDNDDNKNRDISPPKKEKPSLPKKDYTPKDAEKSPGPRRDNSRISENKSKNDGFYDNSFLDDKSNNDDNKPETPVPNPKASSKPFKTQAKKSEKSEDEYDDDYEDEKGGNTFITGNAKAK